MKKNIVFAGLLALSGCSLNPISQQTVYGITAGTGIATFALTLMITKSKGLALFCAAPASLLAYVIGITFTPEGRYKSALKKANHISLNKFAAEAYESDKRFIEELQDRYTDQFWLISSHDELDLLLKEGYHALELLMLVKQEAHEQYELVEKANNLQQKLRTLMANLTSALRRIKNHIDFSAQRTSYNQLLIEKQRLAIEREKAHAQQVQAHAQVSQAQAQHSQAGAMWHAAHKK